MATQFSIIAPRLANDLREAFPVWSREDIAAVIGNLAHESAGFATLQEIRPTVAGSRGGYGYAQWTGQRRRAFEAWASKRNMAINSYEANAGFLIYELKTSESAAVNNTRRAKTLEGKVKAFELTYERAGVKHYESRNKWARKALDVIPEFADAPEVEAMKPAPPKPMTQSTTIWAQIGSVLTTVGAGLAQVFGAIDWKVAAVITTGAVLAFAIWTINERLKHAEKGV